MYMLKMNKNSIKELYLMYNNYNNNDKESQVLGSCQRTKKVMKHEGDRIPIVAGSLGSKESRLSKLQDHWNQPEY